MEAGGRKLRELLADEEQQVCRAEKRPMQPVAHVGALGLSSTGEEKETSSSLRHVKKSSANGAERALGESCWREKWT